MRNEWYKASDKETFGEHKVIKNYVSKELNLVGKRGEIWEYSDTHYAAVITKHTTANRYAKPKEKCKKGDEYIIKFPKEDLNRWVKIVGVKNNRKSMIERANSF